MPRIDPTTGQAHPDSQGHQANQIPSRALEATSNKPAWITAKRRNCRFCDTPMVPYRDETDGTVYWIHVLGSDAEQCAETMGTDD